MFVLCSYSYCSTAHEGRLGSGGVSYNLTAYFNFKNKICTGSCKLMYRKWHDRGEKRSCSLHEIVFNIKWYMYS